MAMQADRLIQDQNFNALYNGTSVGGKTNKFLKAERKGGGLGGRKPLGDLSNSGKPALLNEAPKKQTSKHLTFIGQDSGASKLRNDTNKKKSISRASERAQTGSRKALSDISNSGKARFHEEPKKNLNLKLSAVAEEPLDLPSAIAEEQFLHNHQECIKAQTKAMDMDEFLKTIGLDNAHSKCLASPPPVLCKVKIGSPLKEYHLELEEIAEHVIEDGGPSWKHELLSGKPASPAPCKTPKSAYHFTTGKDSELINFELMKSPELSRH